MKSLKIIIIFIFLLLSVFVYAEETVVQSTGFSEIRGSENDARGNAILNAELQAIEQVCGVMIKQKITASNYEIISKTLESYTTGNIKSYTVISENKTESEYSVTIEAVVIKNTVQEENKISEKKIEEVQKTEIKSQKETKPKLNKIAQSSDFYIKNGVLLLYTGSDNNIVIIPESVTMIDYKAFYENFEIEQVVLPEGLKVIGDEAFAKCNLKKINLPDNLEYIGSEALLNCGLDIYALPKNISYLGNRCFSGNNIHKLVLSGNIQINQIDFKLNQSEILIENFPCIKSGKFKGSGISFYRKNKYANDDKKYDIKSLIIKSSVDKIETEAFTECSIDELVYERDVLEEGIFNECVINFDNVKISPNTIIMDENFKREYERTKYQKENNIVSADFKNISEINDYAFCKILYNDNYHDWDTEKYVKQLNDKIETITKTVIPGNIKRIGKYAFYAQPLNKIIIEEGVEEIDDYAFANCKFTEIELPKSLKRIGKYAFENIKLNKVVIPNKVKEIGSYAFANTNKLKELIIEEGIEKIDDYAFAFAGYDEKDGLYHYPNMISISLPDSLKKIGAHAFEECWCKVLIPMEVKEIGECAFKHILSNRHRSKINCAKLSERKVGVEAFGGYVDLSEQMFVIEW